MSDVHEKSLALAKEWLDNTPDEQFLNEYYDIVFRQNGLTQHQIRLIEKQVEIGDDHIFTYINKDGKDIYYFERLGQCCGPWLSVTCRALKKKGFISVDKREKGSLLYLGNVVESFRVVFYKDPK